MKNLVNPKLSELSARYIEHLAISVTPISSRLAYKRRLERQVLPLIGGLKVKDLQRADVENLIAELNRKGASPATYALQRTHFVGLSLRMCLSAKAGLISDGK